MKHREQFNVEFCRMSVRQTGDRTVGKGKQVWI